MENGNGASMPFTATAGTPVVCQAAILWKPGDKFVLQNIVVAPPAKDQVRIKIAYTSICHTDVTCGKMEAAAPLFPIILGHEAAGVVESVGECVTNVKTNDHVIPFLQAYCDDCTNCKGDRTIVCKKIPLTAFSSTVHGSSTPCYTTEDGKPLTTFFGLSTFSQYILVHKNCVAKISEGAPLNKVGPLACGLATGFGAVWKVAKVPEGATVAVFGLGTVGLAAVEACKIAGASRIIGVDINSKKAELAKSLGVTDFVNPAEHKDVPISKVIKEMTGDGVQFSFECVGVPNLMAEAIESTDQVIGFTVLLGVSEGIVPFEINSQSFTSGRIVMGALVGGHKAKDLPGLVERAMRKDFDLDTYITHTMKLSEINEAMDIFAAGKCLRISLKSDE